jgi:hypothetical protein
MAFACGAASATAPSGGIVGAVLIGPMCPVVRAGIACPDRPYPATIGVQDQSGKRVTQFQTDSAGQFKISLAPGTYTLVPQSPDGFTRAGPQDVTVSGGQFTRVTINYDSGIR